MVSQVTKVINKEGFHMRPANMFVKEMTAFQSDVHLILNGKDINAKSIMNIMAGCIKCGSQLEVRADGPDENEALAKAVSLIESGLGEDEDPAFLQTRCGCQLDRDRQSRSHCSSVASDASNHFGCIAAVFGGSLYLRNGSIRICFRHRIRGKQKNERNK